MKIGKKERLGWGWQEKIGKWNRASFDYSIGFLFLIGVLMTATHGTRWQMMGATVGVLGMWIDVAWLLIPHCLIWRDENSVFNKSWHNFDRVAGYRSLLNRLVKPALWGDYVTHLPFHAHAAQNGNVRVITRNCTPPRRRSPARHTKRASGAARKAGDDGDGGDGDGEPPRPRSSHSPTPTPPLHHSLTPHPLPARSLTIAGGAQ